MINKNPKKGDKVFFVNNLKIFECIVVKISKEKIPCYTMYDHTGRSYSTYEPHFYDQASQDIISSNKVFTNRDEAVKQIKFDIKRRIKNGRATIKEEEKRIKKYKLQLKNIK